MSQVDAVVVSYNSREHLRRCVEPLAELPDVNVIVVDNASSDGTLETVADLPLTVVARTTNGGFAVGCNAGWHAGNSPYVLFLNPDATIDDGSLSRLVAAIRRDTTAGVVVPRIEYPYGALAFSLRRFPRLTSSLAEALFLHRVLFTLGASEIVRNERLYRSSWTPEWASGACMLLPRPLLERLGGWDERFFLYGEDVDLCKRVWDAGFEVRFVPDATVVHVEGASAPTSASLPRLAAARLVYARKHRGTIGYQAARAIVALGALTHLIVGAGGIPARRGHLAALRAAFRGAAGVSSGID